MTAAPLVESFNESGSTDRQPLFKFNIFNHFFLNKQRYNIFEHSIM